jgi:5-methyltetrahydrofolate--homocysteine methyltransferase
MQEQQRRQGRVSALLSPERKAAFLKETGTRQDQLRADFAERRNRKPVLPLPTARARRPGGR